MYLVHAVDAEDPTHVVEPPSPDHPSDRPLGMPVHVKMLHGLVLKPYPPPDRHKVLPACIR